MQHDPRRERVVVVADLGTTRRHLSRSLFDSRVDVFTHADVSDLLDFAAWAEPAVIFLGLANPAANLAALHALRTLPALKDCAIAYLAPPPAPADAPPAAATGIDERLGVAPTAGELQRLVERHVRRRAPQRNGTRP